MKFIIAPDSFKGGLTAKEAAQAIKTGLQRVFPEAEYILIPMADGGEGTVQSLVDATAGQLITTKVHNPLNNWSMLNTESLVISKLPLSKWPKLAVYNLLINKPLIP